MCDYLAEGETEADVVARCAEVMRFDVAGGARGVVLAEPENGENGGGSRRDDASPPRATPKKKTALSGEKSSASSYAAYALGAGVALVSAGLANLVMHSPDIAECVGELCERAAEAAEGGAY